MSDAPKLPTPLEYDYVDYLIDRDTRFEQRETRDSKKMPELLWTSAYPKDRIENGRYVNTHNASFRQQMWQLKDERDVEDKFYDEHGYIYWDGNASGDRMVWRANWTEEDTEAFLDDYFSTET